MAPPSPPSPLSPPPPPPSPPPRRRRRRRPGNHRPRRPAPTRWGATPSRGTMQTPPVGWRACTLQLATAQSPEQYARLLAFAGGTDVWVAGGNPGYDVGTCTSTKWNDWPCYELLEYVCQTASALCRPRRRPRRRWPYTRACGTAIWTRSCGTATFRCGTTGSSCSSRRRPIAGQLARLRSYGAVEPFHVSSLTAKSRVVLLCQQDGCVFDAPTSCMRLGAPLHLR